MSAQYGRKISLIIAPASGQNAVDLSQLHFKFEVLRGDVQTPNSVNIRVYNVSNELAQAAKNKEFTQVILQAGYEGGNFGIIFSGNIFQIRLGRESATDTYMDITGGDGDEAYNFAVVNAILPAGSSPGQAINVLTSSMNPNGVVAGYMPELPTTPLPRSKTMFGNSRNYLRDIANSMGCTWSIQDGQLTFLPLTGVFPGQAFKINAATGMIGIPTQTLNGIIVKMLLNPAIKIGSTIQINNADIQDFKYGQSVTESIPNLQIKTIINKNADGFYRVLIAEHEGDTRGNPWYTNVICLDVNQTQIPPALINKIAVPVPGQVLPYG